MHTGSCLCGAVRFEVDGAIPKPDACHCTQCRKQSGHYFVSTDVLQENLRVDEDGELTWFQSSDRVRRGFCVACGSSLFWEAEGAATIGVAMGCFDGPTDTSIAVHIFVDHKGDYYTIGDDVPQFGTVPPRGHSVE